MMFQYDFYSTKKILSKKKRHLGISGLGVPSFLPSSLSNLKNWFVNNLSIGDTGCIKWMDYLTASNGACGIAQPGHAFAFNGNLVPPPTYNTIATLAGYNVLGQVNTFSPLGNALGNLLIGAADSLTSIGIMNATGQGGTAPGQAHAMQDSPSPSQIAVGLGGGGNNNNLRLDVRSNNNQRILIDGGNFVGTGWQIVCWQYNVATKTGKLIWGGNTFTGTNALMDNLIFTNPTSVYYLGLNYNIVPYYDWQGYLGEFVEYTGLKTNAEINQLGNYFANKYGLVWTNI